MKVYAYVTAEHCVVKRAVLPGTTIGDRGLPQSDGFGKPVSKHGDYSPWYAGKRETLEILNGKGSGLSSFLYKYQCAKMVAWLKGWI